MARLAAMKNVGALCPQCRGADVLLMGHYAHGYTEDEPDWTEDTRPEFGCGSCGNRWTSGKDGAPYLAFARKPPVDQWGVRRKIPGERTRRPAPRCARCLRDGKRVRVYWTNRKRAKWRRWAFNLPPMLRIRPGWTCHRCGSLRPKEVVRA